MPIDRNKLIDDYTRAVTQYGVYSREAKVVADAIEAAGMEIPSEYTRNDTRSALRYQQSAEQIAAREKRIEEEADRYPQVGGLLLKRPMTALEREHYDAVQLYGVDDPHTRNLEKEVVKRRLSPLTEESVIPLMRRPAGDTGFFAPPPEYPMTEREKGLLDTLITPLLLGEQASGTAIYALRKKLGLGGIDWIEQAEAGEIFKEITPSMALGITTRETDIWTARGVAGLAIDVVLDPTTYVGVGLIGKTAKVAKALRITSKTGDVVTVGRKAVRMVGGRTEEIANAFPHIPIEQARKMAEEEVFEFVAKHPSFLAAKKYVDPSLHFMGRKIAYTKPVTRQLGRAWEAAPLLRQRRAAVEAVRTAFVPYHKVRQAAGVQAAEVFAKFYRAIEHERGQWGKRASDLAKKRPLFIKRTSEQAFNKQVRAYLERGVEPTDPRVLEEAIEIRRGYMEMFEREKEAGLITAEQMRPDYMYHVLTPKARAYLKKELGSEYREGKEAYVYMRQLESAHERTYQGTIDEINEYMRREHDIKEFFVEDPLKAYFMRGVESVRAIESHRLEEAMATGAWAKPVEEISPVAGRTAPKFTPSEIAEKVEKKYGERIDVLRTRLGVPEDVEITTVEDVMQYVQREVTDEDITKSMDAQVLRRVPAKETVVSKAARERAEQYSRRLKPFYELLEDVKAGEIRSATVQRVEKSIELESRGMFAGMRPEKGVTSYTVREYMETPLAQAKRYREYEETIFEIETDIIHYDALIEKEKTRLHPSREYVEQVDIDIGRAQERIELHRELQERTIVELRGEVLSIQRGVIEPAERAIAHQRYIAGIDVTEPLELVQHAADMVGLQKQAGKLVDLVSERAEYTAELGAKTTITPPKKSIMVRVDGEPEEWIYQEKFGTYVPHALVKEIEETIPVEDMLTRYYDPWMAIVRKGYIGYWPSYYVRNIYSAAWQNVYRRVGVEDYAAAMATKYGPEEALVDLGPMYGKVSARELKGMMERQGVTGQIGFVDIPEMFMETGGIAGVSLTKEIQFAETSMHWAMKTTEDMARMPLYIRMMRQGASPEQAAEAVRKFQFEYGAAGLTSFEKRKMKRGFLFYTWFRKNIPLQMQMLAEQPGTFAAAFKTREMMITPEEYNELPEWAKEGFARGGEGGRFYVMDVPLTDLPGLYGREELWFGVTPFAKISMAMALGYDPSTKQPLETPADWGDFFAKTLVGRYKSLEKEIGKVREGEISPEDFAMHQLGGVYVGHHRGLPTRLAYRAAREYERRASEEDYMAAFEAAGPFGAAYYETLWKPEARPRGEVFTREEKWYENINIYSPPWEWGRKEEYIGEDVIVIGYTSEQKDVIAGHKLSDEQKEEVKRIYEEEGAEFAAVYRTLMAMEYHEIRAMLAVRDPVSPEAITEAGIKLRERVGEEAAQKARIKTFYTTEGKPHVVALTAMEAEEWGEWRPPQELIDWLYPETEDEILGMSLGEYAQYIETYDPDYLLTPKERAAKRGREVTWKLERARAKVEEIKVLIGEDVAPTQELIDAEEELREAEVAMAQFIDIERSLYDKKFFEYYKAAKDEGMFDIMTEEEVGQRAMEYASMMTGIPAPTEHPVVRPADKEMMEHLRELYEETGFIPSEAQMEWALRETEGLVILSDEQYEKVSAERAAMGMVEYEQLRELGYIEPIRMMFTDQMDAWAEEYGAIVTPEELHDEYIELHKTMPGIITGAVKSEMGVSTLLAATRVSRTHADRMEELENLLGTGVDR